jgi:hypothetical protein
MLMRSNAPAMIAGSVTASRSSLSAIGIPPTGGGGAGWRLSLLFFNRDLLECGVGRSIAADTGTGTSDAAPFVRALVFSMDYDIDIGCVKAFLRAVPLGGEHVARGRDATASARRAAERTRGAAATVFGSHVSCPVTRPPRRTASP